MSRRRHGPASKRNAQQISGDAIAVARWWSAVARFLLSPRALIVVFAASFLFLGFSSSFQGHRVNLHVEEPLRRILRFKRPSTVASAGPPAQDLAAETTQGFPLRQGRNESPEDPGVDDQYSKYTEKELPAQPHPDHEAQFPRLRARDNAFFRPFEGLEQQASMTAAAGEPSPVLKIDAEPGRRNGAVTLSKSGPAPSRGGGKGVGSEEGSLSETKNLTWNRTESESVPEVSKSGRQEEKASVSSSLRGMADSGVIEKGEFLRVGNAQPDKEKDGDGAEVVDSFSTEGGSLGQNDEDKAAKNAIFKVTGSARQAGMGERAGRAPSPPPHVGGPMNAMSTAVAAEGAGAGGGGEAGSRIEGGGGGLPAYATDPQDVLLDQQGQNGQKRPVMRTCDVSVGDWRLDGVHPLYTDCPFVEDAFRCQVPAGRSFAQYSWYPYACHPTPFSIPSFLSSFRNSTVLFVGDSVAKQAYLSLLCILSSSSASSSQSPIHPDPLPPSLPIPSLSLAFPSHNLTLSFFSDRFLLKSAHNLVGPTAVGANRSEWGPWFHFARAVQPALLVLHVAEAYSGLEALYPDTLQKGENISRQHAGGFMSENVEEEEKGKEEGEEEVESQKEGDVSAIRERQQLESEGDIRSTARRLSGERVVHDSPLSGSVQGTEFLADETYGQKSLRLMLGALRKEALPEVYPGRRRRRQGTGGESNAGGGGGGGGDQGGFIGWARSSDGTWRKVEGSSSGDTNKNSDTADPEGAVGVERQGEREEDAKPLIFFLDLPPSHSFIPSGREGGKEGRRSGDGKRRRSLWGTFDRQRKLREDREGLMLRDRGGLRKKIEGGTARRRLLGEGGRRQDGGTKSSWGREWFRGIKGRTRGDSSNTPRRRGATNSSSASAGSTTDSRGALSQMQNISGSNSGVNSSDIYTSRAEAASTIFSTLPSNSCSSSTQILESWQLPVLNPLQAVIIDELTVVEVEDEEEEEQQQQQHQQVQEEEEEQHQQNQMQADEVEEERQMQEEGERQMQEEDEELMEVLEISAMSMWRADAHVGRRERDKDEDCNNFCLPGVPDSWNEVLYLRLVEKGRIISPY